jgi:hypothetical protein
MSFSVLLSAGENEKISFITKGEKGGSDFSSPLASFSFVFDFSGIQWEIIKTILRIFSLLLLWRVVKHRKNEKIAMVENNFPPLRTRKIIYHFFVPFEAFGFFVFRI